MKKLFLFIALAFCAVSLFAQPIYNEDGIRLYHTPSQEEIEWAKSKGYDTLRLMPSPPPVGQLRPIAEFEPAEAVLIRYPFGIPMSLIKEMAKDTKVITIVSSTSQQNTVLNQYNSNGVNTANCSFLIASNDSYWTRDYGPWFMAIDNSEVAMYDFTYNRPRPNDNLINGILAAYLSANGPTINRYASTIVHAGGNFMNDGVNQAASTDLILSENSLTLQQIKQHYIDYMGIDPYHFTIDPLGAYIAHIDCWGKYLAPDKVMIGQVPTSNPRYTYYEQVANYFASLTSPYGTPMKVYRVYTPGGSSSYTITPYTNSLILNKKVFVPLSGNSNDAAAIQTYKDAMPGYEVIGINYSDWENTDALHCRTHEIADRCMLYVKHQPKFGEIENTGSITFEADIFSFCNNTIYPDSVIVYLKNMDGDFVAHNMSFVENNKWEVTVTGLSSGLVQYYIFAADESGRRECHPYIGAPDPHKFTLTGDPPPPQFPVLSLDKTTSSVTSNGFEVIEDSIKIFNLGDADLTFTITDIDFVQMLSITPQDGTVQAGDSLIIALSYNFEDVENGAYAGSFTIVSNDTDNQTIEISLWAYQDVTITVPVFVLDTTNSSVFSEGIDVIEDFITISNLGNAELIFEITDIDFNEMLTISPLNGIIQSDDSQIITLSYDFSNVENGEYFGSFKMISNDPLTPEIEVFLYAYQNYNGIFDSKISLLNIYPNPANEELHIEICDTRYEIYDVYGRNVSNLKSQISNQKIDISYLPAGVYFIKIENTTYKFVKQ